MFDTYSVYVDRNGSQSAKDDLAAGKQVIVALRIETDVRANRGQGLYDDRIALIWKVKEKKVGETTTPEEKHGADFRANTEPSAQYEDKWAVKTVLENGRYRKKRYQVVTDIIDPDGKTVIPRSKHQPEGKDMDGSGRMALGRLVPGSYQFYHGKNFVGAAALRPRDVQQLAERDVNHDGKINSTDSWRTREASMTIDTGPHSFYIHQGATLNTGSAGCQTLPPVEHRKFFSLLHKQADYYYVLVNLQ